MEALPEAAAELLRGGDGGQTIVRIKDGNPAGRHLVIMDDLGESRATLVECKKLMFADGAIKVSAYVTHGVFQKNSRGRGRGRGKGEVLNLLLDDRFVPFYCGGRGGDGPL